jgi:hypothetical protein
MKNILSNLIAPSVLVAVSMVIVSSSFYTQAAVAAKPVAAPAPTPATPAPAPTSAPTSAPTPAPSSTAPVSKGSISYSATGTNTYNGSNGELSASVLFNYLNNGNLEVKLSNTALKGISDPSDVLTSVFWDYAGSPLNLSLQSATAPTVVSGTGTTGTNVDLKKINEWQYKSTTVTTGLGGDTTTSGATSVSQHYGLGTAGLGIFQGGTGQQFDYAIISGYATNANKPVLGGQFVKDYATFVFSGLAADFNVNNISNIRFQYGTNLAETSIKPVKKKIPESRTIPALALFTIGVLKLTAKNKKLVFES